MTCQEGLASLSRGLSSGTEGSSTCPAGRTLTHPQGKPVLSHPAPSVSEVSSPNEGKGEQGQQLFVGGGKLNQLSRTIILGLLL